MTAVHHTEALIFDTEEVVKCYIQAYARCLFCKSVLFEDNSDILIAVFELII